MLARLLAQVLARLLAQALARLLAQLLVQLLSQPLAEHLAKLLAQQEDMCFQEQLQQPSGGAVTHRPQLLLSPAIDCVSNFGFFDASSAHTARQPRPGAVPASQGAAWSGWGELGGEPHGSRRQSALRSAVVTALTNQRAACQTVCCLSASLWAAALRLL